MKFSELLQRYRKQRDITQEQLAQKAGLSTIAISLLEKGKRKPTLDTVFKIAKALDIDPNDLITLDENVQKVRLSGREVPVISWVHAGRWHEPCETHCVQECGKVYSSYSQSPNLFALRVEGDSMEPEYLHGDTIIVNPEIQAVSGDDVIVKYNDEVSLKRIKYDNNHISLIPINEKYPILVLRGDKVESFRVIGVVIELIRKKR